MAEVKADGRVEFTSLAEYHERHDALVERIDTAMREAQPVSEGTDGFLHLDFGLAESVPRQGCRGAH